MDAIGLRFTEVADTYERVRPRYPAEVFDDVATLTGIPAGARVLEVGCGTGQATRDLLARGWHVHAVEPGAEMVARATANFDGRPFTVDLARFDDWNPQGAIFDMLFSATAYHWVAPALRWRIAADVLRPGGPLALVTTRTVAGGTFDDVYRASAGLHAELAPEMEFGIPQPAEEILVAAEAAREDIGSLWGATETKAGHSLAGPLFTPPELRSYQWLVDYDAAGAAGLLSTYSPYLRVPPERRSRLLAGIADIVSTDFGGVVSRRYLAVLAVARRGADGQDELA